MNGGEFGRLPFARDAYGGTVKLRAAAIDEFVSQIGIGAAYHLAASASDSLVPRVMFVLSHVCEAAPLDELKAFVSVVPGLFIQMPAADALAADAALNAQRHLQISAADALEIGATLNVGRHLRIAATDAFIAGVTLNVEAALAIGATDDLLAFADAISMTVETDQVNITIPAGGRLILDTEHYTVALVVNGVATNVYRYHVGPFAKIDDNVIDLNISAGTGGLLSGFITLLERYL